MSKYKVGDKVRIVDERTSGMSIAGNMDKYLGKIMTIVRVNGIDKCEMLEDGGRWSWFDNMFEGMADDKVELHPDFEEWYNEIKSKWEKVGSHKQFAIYVINRMGFGGGLQNSNYKDIGINYPKLRDEMQNNKEKYTRAILDDNWTLRGEKLYYILDKNGFVMLRKYNDGISGLKVGAEMNVDSFKTDINSIQFTEKEIKKYDERFWQFAEPVEEDE